MAKASVRTKNPRGLQISGPLKGELATFYEVGLYQRGIAERSRYRYRAALLRYQQYLKDKALGLEASIAFLVYLRKSGFAPATLKIYRSALSLFHQWRGESLDFRVKTPRSNPPYIESATVETLLEQARAGKDPKHWAALAIMAFGGLRLSEVATLKVGDVHLANNTLSFVGKGGKSRTIPIPGRVRCVLPELCAKKGSGELLIGLSASGLYKVVKRLAPDLHPHDLRHACFTRLVERGADIKTVQELAGHSNVATTSAYLSLAPKRLEEAMRLLDEEEPIMSKGIPRSKPGGDGHHISQDNTPIFDIAARPVTGERPLMSWELEELKHKNEERARRTSY